MASISKLKEWVFNPTTHVMDDVESILDILGILKTNGMKEIITPMIGEIKAIIDKRICDKQIDAKIKEIEE